MTDEDLRDLFYKKIEELAKIDHNRDIRAGKPEAVFAEFKEPEEVVKITKGYLDSCGKALVTRANKEVIEAIKNEYQSSEVDVQVNEKGRTVSLSKKDESRELQGQEKEKGKQKKGKVALITAGTSDISVGEEAASTAEFLGLEVLRFYDVGVAGIHRLVDPVKEIYDKEVDVIIAIAGMEGALPSVVAGLVDVPVIAVPTSIGYGTNMGGLTPLFSMLQTCSSGVAVVNIDNGFGAAVFANMIAKKSGQ
ncbi:MAG: nickel pincer cofactor biosynthesis protein LarB [Archaeoglobaceae archaeon]